MSNFPNIAVLLLAVVVVPQTAATNENLIAAWDFEDNAPGGVTADLSAIPPLSDGTLLGGAGVITDPLAMRSKVLHVPSGGRLTAVEKPQMDVSDHSLIAFWVYVPDDNAWWDLTLGKGGNGAPRFFINTGGDNLQYVFVWATIISESNGALYDLNTGAWSEQLTRDQWHHIAAQIHPDQCDDGSGNLQDCKVLKLYLDGELVGQNSTLNYLNGGPDDLIYTQNAPFAVSPNANWQGYIDDVAVWDGYAADAVIEGLCDGTYTLFDAPVQRASEKPHDLPVGDLDRNGLINIRDVSWMSQRWLYDCTLLDCGGADLDSDQRVRIPDFAHVSANYRQGYGPTSAVARRFGVPTLQVDTDWMTIPMYSNLHPYVQYLPEFESAGTRVYDFPSTAVQWGAFQVWQAPNLWNYDTLDLFFDRVLTADPDALIIPRIYIGTPQWWLDDPAHADEMELMDDGSGPSPHFAQYSTNPGILPRSGPFPSLASQTWREDMAHALRQYMDHLRLAGYMENVIGFELSGLATEEWYRWSSNRPELAGYGPATITAFRDWLKQRYNHDLAAFRTAWNNPTVTFDTVQVPSYSDRMLNLNTQTWREPATSMAVIDFSQFYNELIPETIDYFAEVIKTNTENTKVVGAFYGYMYGFRGSPSFGHNALEQFNASPYLDYVYTTPSYSHRLMGQGDCYQGPAYSVQLHDKFWFISDDTATVRTKDIFEFYQSQWGWSDQDILNSLNNLAYTDTTEKNRWMLRRSAGLAVCNGMSKAFLDLHATDFASYYSHPDLMDEVALENNFFAASANHDRTRVSEILFVSDEFSCNYVASLDWWNGLLYTQLDLPRLAHIQIGAPGDHILLNDLPLIDPARYMMVVFLNCYHMDSAQRAWVDGLKNNGRLLVFCYAPGYFNQHVRSTANMQSVCGMTLETSTSEALTRLLIQIENGEHTLAQALYNTGPVNRLFGFNGNSAKRVWVNDSNAVRLGGYFGAVLDGMAIREFTDWTSVYCATAFMPAAIYRELARFAGVHIYSETDDTFYANRSYVCLHANGAGSRTLWFPQPVDVYDALSEVFLAGNVTSYTTAYSHGETRIFRYVSVQ